MERRWKWPGIVALGLGLLALLALLRGWGPAAPWQTPMTSETGSRPSHIELRQAPFERGPAQFERDADRDRPMRSTVHSELWMERHAGPPWHGRGSHPGTWLLGPAMLLFLLNQLAALGLMGWLLFTIWRQHKEQPGQPPAAPTTPAGHDPRVE